MKKMTVTVLLALSVMGMSATAAFADDARQQFVTFGPTDIDVTTQGPAGGLFLPTGHHPIFDRLMKLKKSFIKPLLQTSKEPALK